MPSLEATSWSTSAWARLPGPAAPRTSASLSAGTRPVAEIRSATSSASALIGGGVPPRRAPPGGAAPSGVVPGVRRCGGRSVSIYPSFEVSAGGWPHLTQTGSTIPLSEPISPTVRDVLRSPLARVWLPVLAAAGAVATLDRHSDPGDLLYFVHQGERLLSARWAETFADPTLQSGPLQLVLAGAVRSTEALAFVIELGVAVLLLVVLGRLRVPARWQVAVGLAAVVPEGTHFGWPLRLLQASVACGLGAGLALWLRRSVHAVWLVPLAVVIARLALDPVGYGWYWLEAEALALIGAGALITAPPLRARAVRPATAGAQHRPAAPPPPEIGRASCRERV